MFNLLRNVRHEALQHAQCVCKRYAGHSKWQNIKHTKEAADKQKSLYTVTLLNKMRVAVSDSGGQTNPEANRALKQAIDAAIKNNVPKDTWMNFLKKLENVKEIKLEYWCRGPENTFFCLTFCGFPEGVIREKINKALKKSCLLSSSRDLCAHAFAVQGLIVAKAPLADSSMEKAEEAAINAGAEEVVLKEDRGDGFYQFATAAEELWTVTKNLKAASWEVEDAFVHRYAKNPITLSTETMQEISESIMKLQSIPEFVSIVDNISDDSELP